MSIGRSDPSSFGEIKTTMQKMQQDLVEQPVKAMKSLDWNPIAQMQMAAGSSCSAKDVKVSNKTIGFVAIPFVLCALLVIAVGSCTAAGSISSVVGGSLITGISFVLSCLTAIGLVIYKIKFARSDDVDGQRKSRHIYRILGAELVANLTAVVVGVLCIFGVISPMVAGVVAAVASSSVFVPVGYLIKRYKA